MIGLLYKWARIFLLGLYFFFLTKSVSSLIFCRWRFLMSSKPHFLLLFHRRADNFFFRFALKKIWKIVFCFESGSEMEGCCFTF